jgi:hypothetical protein
MKKLTILAAAAATLGLTACSEQLPTSRTTEQAAVARNQDTLLNDTPLPQLRTSLERKNLARRLERINAQNMTGCVYLISQGQVMSFFPVRGKVSSLKSYLTSGDRILDDPNGSYDAGSAIVEAPDLDGAYGDNAEGIFFFTADTDTYVEWAGDYLFTDACLALTQQPRLERQVR